MNNDKFEFYFNGMPVKKVTGNSIIHYPLCKKIWWKLTEFLTKFRYRGSIKLEISNGDLDNIMNAITEGADKNAGN